MEKAKAHICVNRFDRRTVIFTEKTVSVIGPTFNYQGIERGGPTGLESPHSDVQLRAYVKQLEDLDGAIQELQDRKKTVYDEIKAVGFDKETVKTIVRRRRLGTEKVATEELLVKLYEQAIKRVEHAND